MNEIASRVRFRPRSLSGDSFSAEGRVALTLRQMLRKIPLIPPGAAEDQVNCCSIISGELLVRLGFRQVSFD